MTGLTSIATECQMSDKWPKRPVATGILKKPSDR